MIREITEKDLTELLNLYMYLHETKLPEISQHMSAVWKQIIDDENHHIIVAEEDNRLVSSCVCVIIPNLTRGVRPYAFIENVVTHIQYRGKGLATACIQYARELAASAGCYKMMLLTGSKEESTLNFYRRAGFNCEDKMAFIQWL